MSGHCEYSGEYLVHPLQRLVTHHTRGRGDPIETRIKADGHHRLDPSGLSLAAVELLGA